jgi:hypothetical protein
MGISVVTSGNITLTAVARKAVSAGSNNSANLVGQISITSEAVNPVASGTSVTTVIEPNAMSGPVSLYSPQTVDCATLAQVAMVRHASSISSFRIVSCQTKRESQ